MGEIELAWKLAEVARGHLDSKQRNDVYMAIAVDDAFRAMTFLLQKIVRSGVAVPTDLLPELLRWVASYRDHPQQDRLRDLIGRVRTQPFEQSQAVPAPAPTLATTVRYKHPIRKVPGNVRNERTGIKRDIRGGLRQLGERAVLLNDGMRPPPARKRFGS